MNFVNQLLNQNKKSYVTSSAMVSAVTSGASENLIVMTRSIPEIICDDEINYNV